MSEPRAPVGVALAIDGMPCRSETLWTRVGPDAVVIETSIPEPGLGLTLGSTYLANPGVETIAAHALAAEGREARSWSRRIAEASIAGTSAEDPVLLDHLAQLQDVLRADGHRLTISLETTPLERAAARRGE